MNILNIMLLFAVFGLQGASAEEELITGVSPDHSTVVDARQHLMLKIKEKQDVLEELQISSHRRELDHLRTLKDAIALQKDEIHRTQVVLVKELSKHRKQITQENKIITAQLLEKLATLPDETATRLFAELSASQRTMLEELTTQHLAMHSDTRQVITGESEGIRRLLREEFDKQSIFTREEKDTATKRFDALATRIASLEAAQTSNFSELHRSTATAFTQTQQQMKAYYDMLSALDTKTTGLQQEALDAKTRHQTITEILSHFTTFLKEQNESIKYMGENTDIHTKCLRNLMLQLGIHPSQEAHRAVLTPSTTHHLKTPRTTSSNTIPNFTEPKSQAPSPLRKESSSVSLSTQQTSTLASTPATPTAASVQQPLSTKPAPAASAAANSTDVVPMAGIKTLTTPTLAATTTFPFPTTATEQPTATPVAAPPALAESKTPAPAAAAQKVWTHSQAIDNLLKDFKNGMEMLRGEYWTFDATAPRGYSNLGENMGHYKIVEPIKNPL